MRAAAARQARHHLRGHAGLQLSGREVVQEEERHGALHRDIVDAVIHQILAHRVVTAGQEGDFDLGAHAIGRADQHRLLPSGQRVARAERADIGQHARA